MERGATATPSVAKWLPSARPSNQNASPVGHAMRNSARFLAHVATEVAGPRANYFRACGLDPESRRARLLPRVNFQFSDASLQEHCSGQRPLVNFADSSWVGASHSGIKPTRPAPCSITSLPFPVVPVSFLHTFLRSPGAVLSVLVCLLHPDHQTTTL
ncbi:hypothetical protein GY45DRAFT_145519 [Cubamyces sp. BRFM 1775]|nr:hypothetical protein GY45DRAFT_145519 [Cubamyces sp. BRFM 1775]